MAWAFVVGPPSVNDAISLVSQAGDYASLNNSSNGLPSLHRIAVSQVDLNELGFSLTLTPTPLQSHQLVVAFAIVREYTFARLHREKIEIR